MKILIIDGMGGGMGKAIIENIKEEFTAHEIIGVGTNATATSAMLKAGADVGATGENAVLYNSARADIIIGAIGIVFPNSMHGEISPKMAEAIASTAAHKILVPVSKLNATILGVTEKPMQLYLSEINAKIRAVIIDK